MDTVFLDYSRFPENQDVYTSREIVSRHLGRDIEDLTRSQLLMQMKYLKHQVKVLNGGAPIAWPGAAKGAVVYSIRNHDKYGTVEAIRDHLWSIRARLPLKVTKTSGYYKKVDRGSHHILVARTEELQARREAFRHTYPKLP